MIGIIFAVAHLAYLGVCFGHRVENIHRNRQRKGLSMPPQNNETVGMILDEMAGLKAQDGPIECLWDLVQHTQPWLEARGGIITASVMPQLITHAELDPATGDSALAVCYNLAVQRITGEVGDSFQSFDMKRGIMDEPEITRIYFENVRPIRSCGFIKNTRHGFTLGYSPDGVFVDETGQIEGKSREPNIQMRMILERTLPKADMIQVQTGLLASEKEVCDYLSYSNGMAMAVVPVEPDYKTMGAILKAAEVAEERILGFVAKYQDMILNDKNLIPTPRRIMDITA